MRRLRIRRSGRAFLHGRTKTKTENEEKFKMKIEGCMFLALISGGNANNEANAGPLYANTNNSGSNANTNIGAHLMLMKIRNISPAAWQKIK